MLFKYSISLLLFYLLEKSVNNRGMLKIYFDHKFVDSVNFCLIYFKAFLGGVHVTWNCYIFLVKNVLSLCDTLLL